MKSIANIIFAAKMVRAGRPDGRMCGKIFIKGLKTRKKHNY
jgi:hypothetical protein